MNDLPINVIKKITTYLQVKDYKNLQLCNKQLHSDIHSLYQNIKEINLHKFNIFEIYEVIHNQLEYISKYRKSYPQSIQYDIDWCLSRFHSERMKNIKGLTQEQNDIINFKYVAGNIILIQAFAGTGKTTTLMNIAKYNSSKKVLYLTFNKSLVENAKYITGIGNTDICTMHSLALNKVDPDKKINIGKLTLTFIENRFMIDNKDAHIIKKILETFFSSSSKKISECHSVNLNLSNETYYITKASQLWNDIITLQCKVPHDAYLKMYQLQKHRLNYDIIMLDEAQDATECMLSILKCQEHSIRYLVGDIHQQIYGFRNVANPFQNHETKHIKKFTLSQSFRYGYQISHLSNMILNQFKNETKKIYSCDLKTNILTNISQLEEKSKQYTLIARSNIKILKEAFELNNYTSCCLLGKEYNFTKEIQYVQAFHNIDNGIQHHISKLPFSTVNEAKIHFQNLNNYKWVTRINLWIEYGTNELIQKYQSLQIKIVPLEEADVILSTVHQSKGLEYDNVKLSDDFIPLITSLNTIYVYKSRSAIEGYNLLYVAITRAKKNLIINRELYSYLKLKKGDRIYTELTLEKCTICNENIVLNKDEEGINCIGFNSKLLYSIKNKCACKFGMYE